MASNGYHVIKLNGSLFRLDHAHPTLVAGHGFKGGWVFSSGQLLHPDMKRFQINTPVLFAPPNPRAIAGAAAASVAVPSFANFFRNQFGGSSNMDLSNDNCGKMLNGLKSCYESNSSNPSAACAYYVDGFKRMACSQ